MNQTVAVIMSAVVVMIAAVVVLTMGTTILGDFGETTDQHGEERCEFQRQQVIQGDGTINENRLGAMDEDCREVAGESGQEVLKAAMPAPDDSGN